MNEFDDLLDEAEPEPDTIGYAPATVPKAIGDVSGGATGQRREAPRPT